MIEDMFKKKEMAEERKRKLRETKEMRKSLLADNGADVRNSIDFTKRTQKSKAGRRGFQARTSRDKQRDLRQESINTP